MVERLGFGRKANFLKGPVDGELFMGYGDRF